MRVKKSVKKTGTSDNQRKKDEKKNEMQLLEKSFYEKHFFPKILLVQFLEKLYFYILSQELGL